MPSFRPADDPDRRKYQDPEAILAGIGLEPGHVFVDVGCGGGFFALPAARILGRSGRIYAYDRNEEGIEDLRRLGREQGLDNLELSIGDAETTVLGREMADFAFFGLVVCHLSDPVTAFRNARTMISKHGRLVVFDWKKKPTRQGPPMELRLSEGQVVDLVKEAGFGLVSVEDCGNYHYLVMAGILADDGTG